MGPRILSDMTMGTWSSWRRNTVHDFVDGPAVSVQILCTVHTRIVEVCTYRSLVVCCSSESRLNPPAGWIQPVVVLEVVDLAELRSCGGNFCCSLRLSVCRASKYDKIDSKIGSFGNKWWGMVERWGCALTWWFWWSWEERISFLVSHGSICAARR